MSSGDLVQFLHGGGAVVLAVADHCTANIHLRAALHCALYAFVRLSACQPTFNVVVCCSFVQPIRSSCRTAFRYRVVWCCCFRWRSPLTLCVTASNVSWRRPTNQRHNHPLLHGAIDVRVLLSAHLQTHAAHLHARSTTPAMATQMAK